MGAGAAIMGNGAVGAVAGAGVGSGGAAVAAAAGAGRGLLVLGPAFFDVFFAFFAAAFLAMALPPQASPSR